jgi:hypothetical protein
VPAQPECYCDDVTPEKLIYLLARHGGRMFQASAEGTAFEIAKGRYSETANFDVYLKGHAGDALRTGRISRDNDCVEHPALSAALCVQPDVIHGLAEQASMRARGFLARWFYIMARSLVGARQIAAAPVEPAIAQQFRDCMMRVWRLKAHTDAKGKDVPHALCFSKEADQSLRQFEKWLEPKLAAGEELSYLAGWANKLAGGIARLAVILHVAASVGDENKGSLDPISAATAQGAIELGKNYLLPHAQRAFGVMGADARIEMAERVLSWIATKCECSECSESAPPNVRRRDIHQAHRRLFASVDELDPILELLVKYGWLRPTGEGRPGRGGFPSPVYDVNPAIKERAKKRAPGANTPGSPNGDGNI